MAEKKKTVSKPANYFNKTKENVFTENGRCSPGETVSLTSAQAKKYSGLELCQK